MDSLDGSVPKRGDILQTNVGDRRERTCLILRVRRSYRRIPSYRFYVWAERWWELESDFRMRLFRSAMRAGGQRVIQCVCHKKPKERRYASNGWMSE
jgi:hypothetical protein